MLNMDKQNSAGGSGFHPGKRVAFSTRRNNLFRRAEELSEACDAQVGVLIFSCTGDLHEYSNSSMTEIIRQYNRQQREPGWESDQATDVTALQEELNDTKMRLHNLQEYHRQLMGEELSGLSLKDVRNLESQLELSLSSIRLKKEQLMTDRISELQQKKHLVDQENMELRQRAKFFDRGNTELVEKFYGDRNAHETASDYHALSGNYGGYELDPMFDFRPGN